MLFLKLFAVLVTSVIAFIQALDKEKKVKFWLIFFVVFLFGTTMTLEFITSQEKKNQDEKLDQLLTTNKKLNVGVTALQEKLDPFIKKAEKRYPDLTKEEALKKFQTDIERIETRAKILEEKATESKSQISDLQKITQKQKEQLSNYSTYAEVATWNFRGGKVVGSGMEVSSPVSGWMKDYVKDKDGQLQWKCDPSAIAHYRSKIKEQPLYPFPYYFLAICLKRLRDDTWEKYAKDGIQILERTTTIPGHDPGHDDVLKRMKDLFAD